MSTPLQDSNSTESYSSNSTESSLTTDQGKSVSFERSGLMWLLMTLPGGIVLLIALVTATVVCYQKWKERRRRKQYRPPLPEASSLDNIANVYVTSPNEVADAEPSVPSTPFSYRVTTDQLRSAINSRRTHQRDGSNDEKADLSADRDHTSSTNSSHVTRDGRANNGSDREPQNQQPPTGDVIIASGGGGGEVNGVEDDNDYDYDYVEQAQWNSCQPRSISSWSLSKSGNAFARDMQQPTLLSPSNLSLLERQRQDIRNRSRSNELLSSGRTTNAGGYVVMTGVRGLGAAISNGRLASSASGHTLHSHMTGSSHYIVSGDEVEYEGRVVPMNSYDDDESDDGEPEVDYENVPSSKHESKETDDGDAIYYNSVAKLNDEDDDESSPQDCDGDRYYSTLRRGRIVTSELT